MYTELLKRGLLRMFQYGEYIISKLPAEINTDLGLCKVKKCDNLVVGNFLPGQPPTIELR